LETKQRLPHNFLLLKVFLLTRSKNSILITKLTLSLVILFYFNSGLLAQESNWAAWEVEADTLMNRQNYDGAIKLYSKIVNESKLKSKENYRPLYKRAIGYYSSGNLPNALNDISQFIPEFPQNYQAHILRALIYQQMGDEEKQLLDLDKAIELQSSNVELIRWRGGLLLEKGEYQKAKQDLLVARSTQDDPELETNLGLAYYSLEKPDSALISLNKSIELDATYEPAYLYAGSFCLELEKYELGLKYLNLALLINPENVNALFYKGIALVELKKTEEGCSCLSKAFKAGQDDAADYLKQHCYDIYK
jgi:tetratricopeptide (TPR) repeat protein